MPVEVLKAPPPTPGSARRLRRALPARKTHDVSTFKKEKLNDDFSELDEFAKVFENANDDPFDTVRGYGRIANSRVDKLISIDAPPEDITAWSLESSTWALVNDLYMYRTAPPKPPLNLYKTTSNTVAEESFYRQNGAARETLIVISWLQKYGIPFASRDRAISKPELRGIKWQFTRAHTKKAKVAFGGFSGSSQQIAQIKSLDLDAPLRENAGIASEDSAYEHELFRYIFSLLQRGDYQAATTVCEATGNFSLVAAINGLVEYRDPLIDGVTIDTEEATSRGTKRKALWRRMCLQVCRSPKVDKYERAIYGLLCGDLDSVLAVSQGWEAQLLAYAQHLAVTQLETFFSATDRLNISMGELRPFPQSVHNSSLGDILRILASPTSSDEQVRSESEAPFRYLQGSIINNVLHLMIANVRSQIEQSLAGDTENENTIIGERYMLRFLAHLILFLRGIGLDSEVSEDDAVSILQFYIEDLVVCGKGRLVPLYVAQLPPSAAVEAYSYLLADIAADARARSEQFALADKFGLDVATTLRRTVQRVFDDLEDRFPAVVSSAEFDFSESETDDEGQLTGSLLWLVDAGMWGDVVASANALYVRYLLAGRIGAAVVFQSKLGASQVHIAVEQLARSGEDAMTMMVTDEDNGSADAEMIMQAAKYRAEFMQYEALVEAVRMIKQWDGLMAEKPVAPSKGDRARPRWSGNDGSEKESGKFLHAWKNKARNLLNQVQAPLIDIIEHWMVDVELSAIEDGDKTQADAIHRLRVLYVPYMLFELHRIFTDAAMVKTSYAIRGFELVNLVAESTDEMSLGRLLIESEKLSDYLVAVAQLALVVGADPTNGLWRV
ncbi:nuclear pore protein 84/107 [Myxozyma melibiosi]|uniref:Nuclear pore complex protein n=1 Tax=Myxozyma melibiosi TaxID=54550 RepID=A0ABR1EY24_9ASCO